MYILLVDNSWQKPNPFLEKKIKFKYTITQHASVRYRLLYDGV